MTLIYTAYLIIYQIIDCIFDKSRSEVRNKRQIFMFYYSFCVTACVGVNFELRTILIDSDRREKFSMVLLSLRL